jgi:hypothetical protein
MNMRLVLVPNQGVQWHGLIDAGSRSAQEEMGIILISFVKEKMNHRDDTDFLNKLLTRF